MSIKIASMIGLFAILALDSGGIGGASAQSAKALEGTWTLKSADDVGAGGARKPLYGTGAAGILIFLPDGTYALQIHAAGVPKFASGDRLKATPEEYKAVVLANNPHWGKYTVSEADHTIAFQIEHAMFPNWEGTTQKRTYTLKGNDLTYVVTNPPNGGTSPEITWTRAK
jgi:hypothetical protein